MITSAEFNKFRGFARMRVQLAPNGYIVGPNSAGKSTVIESVALAEMCLQRARRQNPTLRVDHRGTSRKAFVLPRVDDDDAEDPVRYEFGQDEAYVGIRWEGGPSIHMVWPEETEEAEGGFFYLELDEGIQPRNTAAVRDAFPPVAVIPVVTPLDRVEELKNVDYIKSKSSSRLASRHFRNHALQMQRNNEWEDFKEFARPWLPEIELLRVELDATANRLNIFYLETGSRVPKELAWAGDGMQIWLQLLWHAFRSKGTRTLLLDEPEVYLHPDLQRRLVRLLDGLGTQVILASHSADVIAEAPADDVVWVDRKAGIARKAKSTQTLSALSASLGSSYNLSLARSLRSQLVLASDCEDMQLIRLLAQRVGATKLASEHAVNLVQLRDVRNWEETTFLGRAIRELLPDRLPALVLLQGGQRPDSINRQLVENLTAPRNTVRVLTMAEFDNYLMNPDVIARVSGAAPEAIYDRLDEALTSLYQRSKAAFVAAELRILGASAETLTAAERDFETAWLEREQRLRLVKGSQVLRSINVWLEAEGYRTVTPRELAKALKPTEIANELFDLLFEIEEQIQ